jgi:hypothetical protein
MIGVDPKDVPNLYGFTRFVAGDDVTSHIFIIEILLCIMSSFIYFLLLKKICFVFHKNFHCFYLSLL